MLKIDEEELPVDPDLIIAETDKKFIHLKELLGQTRTSLGKTLLSQRERLTTQRNWAMQTLTSNPSIQIKSLSKRFNSAQAIASDPAPLEHIF